MTYLVDTDLLVDVLRNRPVAVARLKSMSPKILAVSTMTEAELSFGAENSANPARELGRIDHLLSDFTALLPFDRRAARIHGAVRRATRERPIGPFDGIIASVALAHDLTVLTRNVREFSRVPGLRVEDWSVPA